MATLESIAADVAEIKSMLARNPGGAPAQKMAYETQPLTVEQVVIDGKTINRDGSVWTYDTTGRVGGGEADVKVPVKLTYGYFSKEKDPETHEKLLALFGEHYAAWYEHRDPWAIYKVDIKPLVDGGSVNWINFSWLMAPYSRFVQ